MRLLIHGRERQKKTRDKGKGPKSATLSAPALNALFQRGNSAVAAGRYGECVKAFERWIRSAGRKHPDYSTALGRLIHCKTSAGK